MKSFKLGRHLFIFSFFSGRFKFRWARTDYMSVLTTPIVQLIIIDIDRMTNL